MFGQPKKNILIGNVSFKKDKNGGSGLGKKKKRTVAALGEITEKMEKEETAKNREAVMTAGILGEILK